MSPGGFRGTEEAPAGPLTYHFEANARARRPPFFLGIFRQRGCVMNTYETPSSGPRTFVVDQKTLAACVPHSGSMCLLAGVTYFDEERIECLATSHRSLDNPLRAHGRLGAACGVEYAAQAMAVHGALPITPAVAPAPGALVGLRHVQLEVEALDHIESELVIVCRSLGRDAGAAMYAFAISADGNGLLSGRATVTFARPPRPAFAMVSP